MNIKTKGKCTISEYQRLQSMSYLKQVYPSSVNQLRDESFWSAEELLCVCVNPVSCTVETRTKKSEITLLPSTQKVAGNILKVEIKYSKTSTKA